MLVAGSLVSSRYERELGTSNNPTSIKLTSWQIRANVIRKLNRAAREPEAAGSASQQDSTEIPF